jgi:threonine-phosphate decarboxylase
MRKLTRPYTDPAPLFRHGGASLAGNGAVLDFSVNVNPLGPPASVLRALRRGLRWVARYPDPECRELTQRLAALHRVDASRIVVGNGSNELIYAVARALRPRRVAIAEPTYTEYLRASLGAGAEIDHWLAEGEAFELQPFDPEGAELVWLCNPNNPTGQVWPLARVLADWVAAHPRCVFVADEAFMPLCRRDAGRSLLAHVNTLPNLIVLRSMTKEYALPGIRLGYLVGDPGLVRRLSSELVPWSVNILAQTAGLAALDDDRFAHRTRRWLQRETASFPTSLASVSGDIRPIRSEVNFVLIQLQRSTATKVVARLARRGLAIRDASNFVGLDRRYLRVAVRRRPDNQRLVAELGGVLGAG